MISDESAHDPSGGNNNIGSLLTSNGGGVRLMMGVQLIAPDPTIAEEKLRPFQLDKLIQNVNTPTSPVPDFPQKEDQSNWWLPDEPLPLPKKAGTESAAADAKTENQWTLVRDKWQASDPAETVALWEGLIGWKPPKDDKVAVEPGEAEVKKPILSRKKPDYMIKRIPELFLEAPRLCVAAVG